MQYQTPRSPSTRFDAHSPRPMSVDFMLGTRTVDGARSITPAESIRWLSPRSQDLSVLWDARSPQWSPRLPEHPTNIEFFGVHPVSYSVSTAVSAMERHPPPEIGGTIQLQQSISGEWGEVNIVRGLDIDEDESAATSREDLTLQHLTLAIDETFAPTTNDSCRSVTHNVSPLQCRVSLSASQTSPDEQQSQPPNAGKVTLSPADHLNKVLQHLQQNHTEKTLKSLSRAFADFPNTIDDIDALHAILNIGFILTNKADGRVALECFGHALTGFERIHKNDRVVLALKGMAEISEQQGDYKSARDYYTRAAEVLEEARDEQNAARALNRITYLPEDQHDVSALDYYIRALAACEKAGDDFLCASTHLLIAKIYQKQGLIEKAQNSFSLSLTAFEKVDNDEGVAIVLGCTARIFANSERYDEALQYYSRAMKRFEQAGDGMSMKVVTTLSDIGDISNKLERYDEALHYYKKAVAACEEGNDDQRATILQHMADIYGNSTMAREHYVRSVAAYEEVGNTWNAATALHRLAQKSEDKEETLGYLTRAVELAGKDPAVAKALSETEDTYQQTRDLGLTVSPTELGNICYMTAAFARMEMGNICEQREQYNTALHHYALAFDTFEKIGNISKGAIALRRMAEIYEKLGDSTKAHGCYTQSLAAYEKTGCTADTTVSLIQLARIAKNPYDALGYYKHAVEEFEETNTDLGIVTSLIETGDIFMQLERYDSAEKNYSRALTACQKSGQDDRVATALFKMAEVSVQQGRHKPALEYYIQTLAVYEKLGNHLREETRVLFEMASVYHSQGANDTAFKYYTRSLVVARRWALQLGVSKEWLAYPKT